MIFLVCYLVLKKNFLAPLKTIVLLNIFAETDFCQAQNLYLNIILLLFLF